MCVLRFSMSVEVRERPGFGRVALVAGWVAAAERAVWGNRPAYLT